MNTWMNMRIDEYMDEARNIVFEWLPFGNKYNDGGFKGCSKWKFLLRATKLQS